MQACTQTSPIRPVQSAAVCRCHSAFGMGLVVMASWLQGPTWLMFVGAVLAGCMPSISAMVRARWTVVFRGQPRLQTAYALETVFDEFSFIVGPPVSVGLAVTWFAQAGLLVAGLVLLQGAGALAALRATELGVLVADLSQRATTAAPTLLSLTVLRCLLVLMLSMGELDFGRLRHRLLCGWHGVWGHSMALAC